MRTASQIESLRDRDVPLEMTPEEFRKVGHELVDRIAELFATMDQRPVTPGEDVKHIRSLLGQGAMPEKGTISDQLFEEATDLLFDHSLYNSHPRFWGYITSSAAPVGAEPGMVSVHSAGSTSHSRSARLCRGALAQDDLAYRPGEPEQCGCLPDLAAAASDLLCGVVLPDSPGTSDIGALP